MGIINNRKNRLQIIAKNLKKQFIGIDGIIDNVIDSISAWYIMPNTITRPIIINLIGITGVGKTDLVRRLVKELEMADKYLEIQMDDKTWLNTIESRLLDSGVSEGEYGILLLDEIQRFRSVEEDGSPKEIDHFNDIWTLLSDGRFSSSGGRKEAIYIFMNELEDNLKDKKNNRKNRKEKLKMWEARGMKRLLGLTDEVYEIMRWDREKALKILRDKVDSVSVSLGTDYSKLLIFISGNMDDAYEMSNDVGNADMDADILHEMSKKITIVDIKKSLGRKFKPEQVSRFGNNYIIYPCLSRDSYEKIIVKTLREISDIVTKNTGIDISFDNSVTDFIYKNGVFPMQGVRPVLSTISYTINNNIPNFIISAVENKVKNINIYFKDEHLCSKIGKIEQKIRIRMDVSSIHNRQTKDYGTLISVHEASHAVAYALLFGCSPNQIKSSVSSFDGGYILTHNMTDTKKSLLKSVQVGLAGLAGEEIFFGEGNRSSGSWNDIRSATMIVGKYVRRLGMNGYCATISDNVSDVGLTCVDIKETDGDIEKIVSEQKVVVKNLLERNIKYIVDVSDRLMESGNIDIDDFIKISSKYIKINKIPVEDTITPDYSNMYNLFKNNQK